MRFAIRVTNEQYCRVKLKAEMLGFASVNAYVRSILLRDTVKLNLKIAEIHEALVKNGDESKNYSKVD